MSSEETKQSAYSLKTGKNTTKRYSESKVNEKGGGESSSECDSSDNEGGEVWVQCENSDCRKWRKLPQESTSIDLTQEWFCSMNPDPSRSSCDQPEEQWCHSKKRGFSFSKLDPGELVWAKVKGFCPWPAVISPDPWSNNTSIEEEGEEEEGCVYHVEFLGKTRSHCWIAEGQLEGSSGGKRVTRIKNEVEPYHDSSSCGLGSLRSTKKLEAALNEADSYLHLSREQRLASCQYTEHGVKYKALVKGTQTCRTKLSHPKTHQSGLAVKPSLCDITNLKTNVKKPTKEVGGARLSVSSTGTKLHIPPALKKKDISISRMQNCTDSHGGQLMENTLATQMSTMQTLGIQLTVGNIAKMVSSLQSQQASGSQVVPLRKDRRITTALNTSKPSSKVLAQRYSVGNPSSHKSQQTGATSTSSALSHFTALPLSLCDSLEGGTTNYTYCSPSKLFQTSLSMSGQGGAVQLSKAINTPQPLSRTKKGTQANKRKVCNPSPKLSQKHKKQRGEQSPPSSSSCSSQQQGATIPDYFSPSRDLDQAVPSDLELVARSELQEMEDLLTMFGGGGGGEKRMVCSGSQGGGAEGGASGADIESVLSEICSIEDLIGDLSNGKVVTY